MKLKEATYENVTPIPTAAMEAYRYGVPSKAVQQLLVDYGIISNDDTANAIY